MMPEQQQRILGYFIEEAKDHLNTIEQGLLDLQATIEDPEVVNEVFRAAHSVKGGAAMLGINSIQRTSHRLEDYFKILKESPAQVDRALESMFLQVFDGLQCLLEELQGPFGLTEDKAQEVMHDLEPVFEQLEHHLNALVVSAPETADTVSMAEPAIAAAASGSRTSKTPTVAGEESALKLVFKSDVPSHLRKMLALFKQADTDISREALQSSCEALERIGEQFDLVPWCNLTESTRLVVGNREQTYRALAPVVIKELKRAQEQILAGQANAVAVSESLQDLMPPVAADVASDDLDALLEDALLVDDALLVSEESGFTEIFDEELPQSVTETEAEATLDWLEPSGPGGDEVSEGLNDFATSSDAFSENDLNAAQDANNHEPSVGTSELNSLADLFEGEVANLDSPWEDVSEFGEGVTNNLGPDINIPDDFSDLLENSLEDDPSLDTQQDLTDLFGDASVDGVTTFTEPASDGLTFDEASATDDFADLFEVSENHAAPEGLPSEVVTSSDNDNQSLDNLLDSVSLEEDSFDGEMPSLSMDAGDALGMDSAFDDLGELFEEGDNTDFAADLGAVSSEETASHQDLDLPELLAEEELQPTASNDNQAFDDLWGGNTVPDVPDAEEGALSSGSVFDDISDPWATEGSDADIADESALDALDELWSEAQEFQEDVDSQIDISSGEDDFSDFDDLELDLSNNSDIANNLDNPLAADTEEVENLAGVFEENLDEVPTSFPEGPSSSDERILSENVDGDDTGLDTFLSDDLTENEVLLEDGNSDDDTDLDVLFGSSLAADGNISEDVEPERRDIELDTLLSDAGGEDDALFGGDDSNGNADFDALLGEDLTAAESRADLQDTGSDPDLDASWGINLTTDEGLFEEPPGDDDDIDFEALLSDDLPVDEPLTEGGDLDLGGFEAGNQHYENEAASGTDTIHLTDDLGDLPTDEQSETSDIDLLLEDPESLDPMAAAAADAFLSDIPDFDAPSQTGDDLFEASPIDELLGSELNVDSSEALDDVLVSSQLEPPLDLEAEAISPEGTNDFEHPFDTVETMPDPPSDPADGDLDGDLVGFDGVFAETEPDLALPSDVPNDDLDSLLDREEARNLEHSETPFTERAEADFFGGDESFHADPLEIEAPSSFDFDLEDGHEDVVHVQADEASFDDLLGMSMDEAEPTPVGLSSMQEDISDFFEDTSQSVDASANLESDDFFALADNEVLAETSVSDEQSLDDSLSLDTSAELEPDGLLSEPSFGEVTDDDLFDTPPSQSETGALSESSLAEDSLSLDSPELDADGLLEDATLEPDLFEEPLSQFETEAVDADSLSDIDNLLGEVDSDIETADLFGDPIVQAESEMASSSLFAEDELAIESPTLEEELVLESSEPEVDTLLSDADLDEEMPDLLGDSLPQLGDETASDDAVFEDDFGLGASVLEADGLWEEDSSQEETSDLIDEALPQLESDVDLGSVDFLAADDNFGDLDALLDDSNVDQVTTTDASLSELDTLLADESVAQNDSSDFDELDVLLDDDPSAQPDFASNPEASEFDDLDALLSDEPALSPLDIEDAGAEDEFSDLEKLLEEADQKLGGSSPTIRGNVGARVFRRIGAMVDKTMRVSVKHLDTLNNLVGELVVNRNSLEQDQERLRQFLDNLLFQVQQLNDVGQRMRDLYERSLLESSLMSSRQSLHNTGISRVSESHGSGNGGTGGHATGATFDALEMDRFTGFHTLSQEMIELIVRVRESASDIGYTVESADQITRQFRQVTTQLQEGLNKARMVPFAQTADRLPRAVRDISLQCGKEARLVVEGRETLIDKMILERLYDPMTHLVNNAITHGVETPDERVALGKSREGVITVRAFYQGNQTVIYIADDGAGINPDIVKEKAIKKGILTQAEANAMTVLETYELLFRPGFSTRDKADDFAGRGVGMDVVRTALSEIRGSITIDSELGKGTSFTIRLPLTLSISKALSCLNNQARIAFPMDGVEDMFDVPKDRIQVNENQQSSIQWRDSKLTFQPLSELLQFNRSLGRGRVYGGNQDEDVVSIVVLRSANTFIGLQVDRVLGEQEIVIKQLEGPVPKPMGIAGATVLGDGRVMPIADVLELIDIAQGRVRREVGSSLWTQADEPPAGETVETKTEPTVLIVDDSITVRELLSMSFNKVGYRVEQARDGQEAWEKLRSGLPCDLVFCDIEMPRMDGLELLSRLQKDSILKRVPIAMLTSRGADRHRQMALDLGASGYFTKPYLEEALLDAAQRMLNGEVLLKAGGES